MREVKAGQHMESSGTHHDHNKSRSNLNRSYSPESDEKTSGAVAHDTVGGNNRMAFPAARDARRIWTPDEPSPSCAPEWRSEVSKRHSRAGQERESTWLNVNSGSAHWPGMPASQGGMLIAAKRSLQSHLA